MKSFKQFIAESKIQDNKYYAYSKKHNNLSEPYPNIKDAENFYRKFWKEFDKDGSDTVIASGKDLKQLGYIK